MPRIKVSDIKAAVITMIMKLNGEGQYTTNIPSTLNEDGTFRHIYPAYSQAINTQEDADYPKVVVAYDGGEEVDQVSRRVSESCSVDVIFVLKEIPSTEWDKKVHIQVDDLIDDFKRLRFHNRTLGGVVENLRVIDWTTDSGFDYPEGTIWFRLEAVFKNQF